MPRESVDEEWSGVRDLDRQMILGESSCPFFFYIRLQWVTPALEGHIQADMATSSRLDLLHVLRNYYAKVGIIVPL